MPIKDRIKRLEYCKKYNKTYYSNNKKYYFDKAKKLKTERLKWFMKYKETLKCERCPEDDARCLDFHHLDKNKKEFHIGEMVHNTMSEKNIMEEIKKCIVLCANCHRKEHSKKEE